MTGVHDEAGPCPRCGQPLRVAEGGPPEASASQADSDDAALIADLREAFSLGADAFGSDGPCRLRCAPDSSGGFSGSLGADSLPPGTRLHDFEILGELGRGGMGVVYRARQVSLGRDVALKVLPMYARRGPTAVQRFRVEATAAARLHHTNIVPIYAQGEHNGRFYYAMELVNGVGLDAVIHSRPNLLSATLARRARPSEPGVAEGQCRAPSSERREPVRTVQEPREAAWTEWTHADYRQVAALVAEVADALEYAHRSGVIHRDVKPHNLLLGSNSRLYLTDFGLARLADEPHLTLDGEVMGTPAYLSPEQVRGDVGRIDHRTDVYSLGVTLYEILTRRKPFDGQTREQIISGICGTEPIAPRRVRRRIPIELETICLRAMEKEPEQRYASAALLAEDLRRFAEGRSILSRRRSLLEKTARWARRHKALTAAAVATAGVCALAVGMAWTTAVARHRQARQLLDGAYEQLAFFDYRQPELVRADIARAADLGADPVELHLVQALASLGALDQRVAIEHLQTVLQRDPADLRALYLLAWAQRREGHNAASRGTFEQAESIRAGGAPVTADAWFFRGLAIHFDEPPTAIESYRQANALRAREHSFYPQAVLHLARARNQQLYATRSLDTLAEADASLRQLVENEQYGAYPYYLLSIAHRLAAEVYAGSQGTRDDSLVAEHYAQALDWAHRGQEIAPDYDRPITAEAECLESMGRYAEAIDARTRAIATADNQRARCEGYHYRWRLHYWTGQLDAALDDVAAHAECVPQSQLYAHVYPALILAETGQMPDALAEARAPADEQPDHALAVIWSASCLRLLGRSEEALTLLAEREDEIDFTAELAAPQSEQWVRALYAHCLGNVSLAALEQLAEQADTPWRLWGEAHFHAGALALAEGDRQTALKRFRTAYRAFDGELRYTYHARLILIRMQQDPDWPPWIPLGDTAGNVGPDEPEAEATAMPSFGEDGGT